MPAPPECHVADGLLFYGARLEKNSTIAIAAEVDIPATSEAGEGYLQQLHDQLRASLGLVQQGVFLQLIWTVDSDYEEVIDRYLEHTETATSRWNRLVRAERALRMHQRMRNGQLRKERLVVFLGKRCDILPKNWKGTAEQNEAFLTQQKMGLIATLTNVLSVWPNRHFDLLDDYGLFRVWYRHFNPSFTATRNDPFWREAFIPDESLQAQCWNSDGVSTSLGDGDNGMGFVWDGLFHAMLVLRTWPRQVCPGDIRRLTQIAGINYSITQTLLPLDVQKEADREIRDLTKMSVEMQTSKSGFAIQSEVEERKRKLYTLQSGDVAPYRVLTLVRVWATDRNKLIAQCLSLKSAVATLFGASFHQANQPVQARNLFWETTPGWMSSSYQGWTLYGDSSFLPALMPVSTTYTGHLQEAEVFFDGLNNNLVGLRTFSDETPQNTCLLGSSGCGKSVLLDEILSQNAHLYSYTCIIEEGLSHQTVALLLGGVSIVLGPNATYTLNYFDTQGAPLTAEHLAFCASLLNRLAGSVQGDNEAVQNISYLREYVNELYWGVYNDWASKHPQAARDLARLAYGCEIYRGRHMGVDAGMAEAWNELRDLKTNDPAAYRRLISEPSEDDIIRWEKMGTNDVSIRNLAFAYFRPEDFPQHTQLVTMMRFSKLTGHPPSRIDYLATQLSAWCRDGGSNGVLFDGVTNIDLNAPVVHFELGRIPESAKALKDAAAFLVVNVVRQKIIAMSRSLKKRLLFEEAARFREIPGADQILAESYAQMRKYACWVCTVLQQYGQIKTSPLASVIFGNSKQFIVMRQNDKDDLAELAQRIGLPETAVKAIASYQLPEHMPPESRASYATILSDAGGYMQCGTVVCVPSPELLYVASSGGSAHEERTRFLSNYKDPVDGVLSAIALKTKH